MPICGFTGGTLSHLLLGYLFRTQRFGLQDLQHPHNTSICIQTHTHIEATSTIQLSRVNLNKRNQKVFSHNLQESQNNKWVVLDTRLLGNNYKTIPMI